MTKKESYPKLVAFLKAHPGPAIVYVTLQKQASELAERLCRLGVRAKCFHAGMAPDLKAAVQDEFMASDTLVITATIAFGVRRMKIGRHDVSGSLTLFTDGNRQKQHQKRCPLRYPAQSGRIW